MGMGQGAGMLNAGIQVAGQIAQGRSQRKNNSRQRRMVKRNRAAQMREMDLEKQDINRGFNDAASGINADAAGAGDETSANFHSSQRQYNQGQVSQERNRRLDALERQRALMNDTWHDEDKIMKTQKKMARLQQYLDYTNQFLGSMS